MVSPPAIFVSIGSGDVRPEAARRTDHSNETTNTLSPTTLVPEVSQISTRVS